LRNTFRNPECPKNSDSPTRIGDDNYVGFIEEDAADCIGGESPGRGEIRDFVVALARVEG
jgi:hypothetical protein